MSNKPLFQHRHYCKIAEIIAALPDDLRGKIAYHFMNALNNTNPQFSAARFLAAAEGRPVNRDKVRS